MSVGEGRYFPFLPSVFLFKEVLPLCEGLDFGKYTDFFFDESPTPPFASDSEGSSDTFDEPDVPGTPVRVLRHRILELERQLSERDAIITELRAKRVPVPEESENRQPRKIQRLLSSQISTILTTDEERAEHFDRFIQENCQSTDINPVKHSVLHRAYHQWSLEQHVEPLSIAQIRAQMERLGVETGNRTGNRTYRGIKLK